MTKGIVSDCVKWCIDSGATDHMVNDDRLFVKENLIVPIQVDVNEAVH